MDAAQGDDRQKNRHLLLLCDDNSKQLIALEAATYLIGRDPSNSIIIQSKWSSRQHAVLLRVTAPTSSHYAFRIIDGDLQGHPSTNGLVINGQRCSAHDLKHGDFIRFGKATFATYYLISGMSDQEFLYCSDTGEIDRFLAESPGSSKTVTADPALESISESVLMRLASFPELTPFPIVEIDFQGKPTYLNPAAIRQFPELQQAIKFPPESVTHPLLCGLNHDSYSIEQRYFVRELEIERKAFQQWVQFLPESDLIRFYITDITEKKQTELALGKSRAKIGALLNAIPDLILQINLNGVLVDLKPAHRMELLQPTIADIAKNIHEFLPTGLAQQIMHHLKQALTMQEVCLFEYELFHQPQLYYYEVCLVASDDNEGVVMIRDITTRKQLENRLLHDALHDPLTGLPNRHLFLNRLSHVIELSKRRNLNQYAVLFIDLDRFKFVNDSLGHTIGDQLLISISRRLEDCLRSGDTVARLGGDEFAILLEDLPNPNEAMLVGERLIKAISQPMHLDNHEVFVTASVGIASGLHNYDHPEAMLRDADTAMYHAKSLGKSRCEVFDQVMHQRVVALLQLDSDLRRAIEREEFRLLYQPIVALSTGTIVGFETLIRWQHPQRGLLAPSEFIQLAEETGLIVPLGEWILYESCHQTHLWQLKFPALSPLSVSVNLSSKQFLQRDLVEQVSQVLRYTHLPAQTLKLEITESVVMENTKVSKNALLNLKALNVQLCIDDFGTGYSSLSYLHRFPIDTLKVDRSFISTIDTNNENSKLMITQTIIGLARHLKLSVVAEGVETAHQVAQLCKLQCEYAQGYYFAKPLEAEMAEALLDTQPSWEHEICQVP